jgi:hypothetical protein
MYLDFCSMTQKAILIWRYWWYWVSFLLIWRLTYFIASRIETQHFDFSYNVTLFVSDIGSASAISIIPILMILIAKAGITSGLSIFHWLYFLSISFGLSLLLTISIPTMSQSAGSFTLYHKLQTALSEPLAKGYNGIFKSIRISFSFFAVSFVTSSIAFHRFFWLRYKSTK